MRFLAVPLLALVFFGVAARPAERATYRLCRGADLTGSFTVVRGSPAAGQISYRLRVAVPAGACTLSGIPRVRLLDSHRRALPTDARPAPPPRPKPRVLVRAGRPAVLTARFSPDVPGVGEGTVGRCEPRASFLRVQAPGGGSVAVPVVPPTSVCEHGRMFLTPFA